MLYDVVLHLYIDLLSNVNNIHAYRNNIFSGRVSELVIKRLQVQPSGFLGFQSHHGKKCAFSM